MLGDEKKENNRETNGVTAKDKSFENASISDSFRANSIGSSIYESQELENESLLYMNWQDDDWQQIAICLPCYLVVEIINLTLKSVMWLLENVFFGMHVDHYLRLRRENPLEMWRAYMYAATIIAGLIVDVTHVHLYTPNHLERDMGLTHMTAIETGFFDTAYYSLATLFWIHVPAYMMLFFVDPEKKLCHQESTPSHYVEMNHHGSDEAREERPRCFDCC